MELPPHARTLTLPKDNRIRILAISVVWENPEVEPAQPLYDMLQRPDSVEKEQVGNE
jgi:alpha-mannosidase